MKGRDVIVFGLVAATAWLSSFVIVARQNSSNPLNQISHLSTKSVRRYARLFHLNSDRDMGYELQEFLTMSSASGAAAKNLLDQSLTAAGGWTRTTDQSSVYYTRNNGGYREGISIDFGPQGAEADHFKQLAPFDVWSLRITHFGIGPFENVAVATNGVA